MLLPLKFHLLHLTARKAEEGSIVGAQEKEGVWVLINWWQTAIPESWVSVHCQGNFEIGWASAEGREGKGLSLTPTEALETQTWPLWFWLAAPTWNWSWWDCWNAGVCRWGGPNNRSRSRGGCSSSWQKSKFRGGQDCSWSHRGHRQWQSSTKRHRNSSTSGTCPSEMEVLERWRSRDALLVNGNNALEWGIPS